MKLPSFKCETNWVAVTGAPSSGKTSVIEELARRGYAVQSEVARELIQDELEDGKTLADIRDKDHVQDFQRRILNMKRARERALQPGTLVFMDRGLPDSIAYYRISGLDDRLAVEASLAFHYRAVFLLDRLPVVKDGVRTEDNAEAEAIEKMLVEDYKALGYDVVRVPVVSVPQRADFILKHLGVDKPV